MMPALSPRPCSRPGCPNLGTGGPCESCARTKEQERGTSTQRGYGARYRKGFRAPVLREWPLCPDPYGLHPNVIKPATVSDHWLAKSAGGMDDTSNGVGMCRRCHDHKRQREARGIFEYGPRPRNPISEERVA